MTQESYQEQMSYWLNLWKKGEAILWSLVSLCEECIAKTGQASFFSNAPVEVQEGILEDIQQFRKHGSWVFFVARTDFYVDKSKEMEKIIEVLEAGNLIEKEVIHPVPFPNGIEGITYIHGGELLQDILGYSPNLSDSSFTEFSIKQYNPHIGKYFAEFSILLEHFVRDYLDEEKFNRKVVAQWSASFILKNANLQIKELQKTSPPAMSVSKKRVGLREYFEVQLNDFFGQSAIFRCTEIQLVKLEHLEISDKNCSSE